MEKTPEPTANVTATGSEPERFTVPKLTVPTLSHPRMSAATDAPAKPESTPKGVEKSDTPSLSPAIAELGDEPAVGKPEVDGQAAGAANEDATSEEDAPQVADHDDATSEEDAPKVAEPEDATPQVAAHDVELAESASAVVDDAAHTGRQSWSKRLGLAFALPKVSMPKLSLPKVNLPKATLPKLRLPTVALPTLALGRAAKADVGSTAVAESSAVSAAPAKSTVTKSALVTSASSKTLAKSPPPAKAPAVAAKRRPRGKPTTVLLVKGLTKRFDETVAVDSVDLEVKSGSFYGIVGPNGAGKTTTLSMITGLLRPDAGSVSINGADVWADPVAAKRNMGVLPDRLRLFDRLTGAQLLYYAGALRGMDSHTVRERSADLANAFGLDAALGRLVSDYSAGMTKKIALAAAMIHSPRLLVLDEPFESVDPVSAATVTDILKKYAAEGGTVLLSSHSMDLVQRICDNVAVVVGGSILADGTMAAVRDGHTLEERFVELAGGRKTVEGLEWLHSFSD